MRVQKYTAAGGQPSTNAAMKNMPRQTTTIWTAVVDEELTSRSYIVPGIGDAGDLAYGEKI